MRIDKPGQGRAAGEIDDRGPARLEADQRALVTDRNDLAALDRERGRDRRARQRTDRPAAKDEVGALASGEAGRGPGGGKRGSRGDRISHERTSGGHARRLADDVGHSAGMELVTKKERTETAEAHFEPSGAEPRAFRTV